MSHDACRLLVVIALAMVGCNSGGTPQAKVEPSKGPGALGQVRGPVGKPVPPLELAEPPAQPGRYKEDDLTGMEAGDLRSLARVGSNRNDYRLAAAAQYWHVQKAKDGQYDLACYLSRIGQVEPAIYWLQRAAIEEGVDTQHAQRDSDLVALRADPRWGKVLKYMEDCNRYFETAPLGRTVVVVPDGYMKGEPIPVVVWLHGMGSRPEDFVNDDCKELATAMKVAIVGVSGTKPRGPRSFVWAENADADARRLREALAEVADRVTVKKGHVIAFGFSQGAQMGLEVAVRNPDDYAGAIVLSPGADFGLNRAKPSPELARRGFVVACGAKEHPGTVQLTAMDADWLRKAGAKVIHKPYPGMSAHAFPADFVERFPEWVAFVLKARGD